MLRRESITAPDPDELSESTEHSTDYCFPVLLMTVLSTPSLNHIISWNEAGDSFNVHKPKEFETDVLAEHLHLSKYSSFTKELRRWGFVREYKGQDAGGYSHEEFLRDRMDLVEEMTGYQLTSPTSSPMTKQKRLSLIDGPDSDGENDQDASHSGLSYQEMLDTFRHQEDDQRGSNFQSSQNHLVTAGSFDDVGLDNGIVLPDTNPRRSSVSGMFQAIVGKSASAFSSGPSTSTGRRSSDARGSGRRQRQQRGSMLARAFGSNEASTSPKSGQAPITFASSMVDDPALLSIYSRQATADSIPATQLKRAQSEQPTTRHMWHQPTRSRSGQGFNVPIASRKRYHFEQNWIQFALLVLGATLCGVAGAGIYIILQRDEARAEIGSSATTEGVQVKEANAEAVDGGRIRSLSELFNGPQPHDY